MQRFLHSLRFFLLLATTSLYAQHGVQPTQAQIDAATATAIAKGRVVSTIPAVLQNASLPITFRSKLSDWNYDITVFKMDVSLSGSSVSVGCKFYIPNSPTNASIYFGATNIRVSATSGFSGELPILESSLSTANSSEIDDPHNKLNGETSFFEIALPQFAGKGRLGLDKNTKVSFDCGEFKKFVISGYLKVFGLVERESPDGVSIDDSKPLLFFLGSKDIFDWQDMYFENVTASGGFHASNVKDLGFHATPQTKITIDLSKYQSPTNLPTCGTTNNEDWQGIAYTDFSLRLPKLFRLRSPRALMGQGSNLFLTPNGISGNVVSEKVFGLTEGYTDEVNKFDMSLDQVTANYGCGSETVVNMLGKIRLGNCNNSSDKSKELLYNVVYTAKDQRYQVLVKEKEADIFKNAGITLSTGSTVSISMATDGFKLKGALATKPVLSTDSYNNSICKTFSTNLSVVGCENLSSKWTSGSSNVNRISISPTITTTYSVNCYDKFCINENSEDLTITVLENLPLPTIIASASTICTYQSADLTSGNCVGKTEWKLPNTNSFVEQSNQKVSYPDLTASNSYTYTLRCNLNGCLSPEKQQTITVYPTPQPPSLSSSAANNTIDRNASVTLYGGCAANQGIFWDNLTQPTVTLNKTNSYSAYCKDQVTGCQSQSASITINVLYFPPSAASNLRFSGVTTNRLRLEWNDKANNETGFKVYRSTSNSFGSATEIGNLPSNATAFDNDNLSENITYYYWVLAYNQYDTALSQFGSIHTNSTIIATQTPVIPPSQPNTPQTPIVPSQPNTPQIPTCNTPSPSMGASATTITTGGTVSISANCGTGNVVWTAPSGFNGGNHQPNSSTTYKAKCRESNGCESGEASITIPVNDPACVPPSAPNISANRTTICSGNEVILSASGCNGTVSWSGGNNKIYPTSSTSYTATCSVGGCTSTSSNTISINVLQPPTPTITLNTTSMLVGETVSVSGSCSSGYSLIWTAPNGFSGGNSSPSSTTTYSAKCRLYEGCESNEASQTLSVGCPIVTAPALSIIDVTVAYGAVGTLRVYGCSGIVSWSSGVPSSGSSGESITVGAGTYTATCTVTNYCGNSATSSAEGRVNVEGCSVEKPTNVYATKTELNAGETTTLNATSSNNVIWLKDGAYFGSPNSAGPGRYKARATNGRCDSDYSSEIEITLKTETTPTPWISCSRLVVCEGSTTTLEAKNCTGTAHWSNGSTDRNITIGVGIYTLYCRNNGINSESADITISSVPLPAVPTNPYADALTLYNDETTGLHASSQAANVSVIWVKNGSYFDSGNDINEVGAGTYKARAVLNGCDSDYTADIVISNALPTDISTNIPDEIPTTIPDKPSSGVPSATYYSFNVSTILLGSLTVPAYSRSKQLGNGMVLYNDPECTKPFWLNGSAKIEDCDVVITNGIVANVNCPRT